MAWPFSHAGGQQKPGRMGHSPMEITVALEGCTKMGELVCSNRLYVKWLPLSPDRIWGMDTVSEWGMFPLLVLWLGELSLPHAVVTGPGLPLPRLEAEMIPKQENCVLNHYVSIPKCPVGQAVPSLYLPKLGQTGNAATSPGGKDSPLTSAPGSPRPP